MESSLSLVLVSYIYTSAFSLVVMTCYEENDMVIDIFKIYNVKIKLLKLSSVVMLSCQRTEQMPNSKLCHFIY